MSLPSDFNKTPDNQQPEGILTLLIAEAVVVALLSVGAAILDRAGFPVPPILTLMVGVLVGVPLGMGIAACQRERRGS